MTQYNGTAQQSAAIAHAAVDQVEITLKAIAYLELIGTEVLPDLEPIIEAMLSDVKVKVANTLEALQALLPEDEREADVLDYIDQTVAKFAERGEALNIGAQIKVSLALSKALERVQGSKEA